MNNAVKARISAETCIKLLRKRFGGNFADDGFWADICFNLNSQSACPWTHKLYDVLREELFYRALMLQKAFVLGSNGVKQNLNRLFDMWDGRFGAEDRKTAYGTLVNTLFFVIPAISTTFASARTFLDGVAPGKLGVMIVDEAGQATPQSVLGALWRTRKAIIVGDPLQVEPILTTPPILCKWFADEYGLPAVYKAPDLSVQTLADAQNPYGGYREAGGAQLWLGCPLIIHRRCIEPMFGISNRLAYNERMFCRTDPPSPGKLFMLGKSAWFDIAGIETGNKDHTVKEQIILAERLFNDFIVQSGRLPDVYFITPFISVKRSIEKALRHTLRACMPEMDENNIDFWIGERCGTIHTFQGKETDEVLLVMGCDNQKGLGAARWVGQKPNIMNVAVSRARYRIGVIGDYKLWITIPYVNLLCELLG